MALKVEEAPTPEVYPSEALIECPYPFFDRMRAEKPVCPAVGRDEYLVFRHADIVRVLQDQDVFVDRFPEGTSMDWKGATMISAHEGIEHAQIRRLASRPFTPRRLRGYEPMLTGLVDELIDRFIGRGEFDFMAEFANPLPRRLMCRLMGLPEQGEEYEFLFGRPLGMAATAGAGDYMTQRLEYFERKLLERVVRPTDDILSEYIAAQVERDGELNLPYLTVIAQELMVGGGGTSSHMMGNAMWLLLENPAQLEKVLADTSLIPEMIEESLRAESVIQERERMVTADTEVGGVPIAAGMRVRIVLASGNRDPEAFPDPQQFDVERANENLKRHFGFGYGVHFCLGAPLARLEGKIAFERLFARLRNLSFAEGKNDFEHILNTHSRAFRALQLTFERV